MMQGIRRQRGLTAISILLIALIVAFVVTIGFRILPIYTQSFKVSAALSQMADEQQYAGSDTRELREALFKRLGIEDVTVVEREHVSFENVAGGTRITVEYEHRVPVISNLDVVASFHKQAVVRN